MLQKDVETILLNLGRASQGHAEDVLFRHRFLYYVLGKPIWPDYLYDAAEAVVVRRYPKTRLAFLVGSSNVIDYQPYICEGRRPTADERNRRDSLITQFNDIF